ncbi:MAG: formate dehydrogenase accessory sulfurtransferase FdhD [bacterium JZ-2024 1]
MATVRRRVTAMQGASAKACYDAVVVEEPLEIRVVAWNHHRTEHHTIAITMRTPGHDAELAAGFLFSEGVIRSSDDIEAISPCPPVNGESARNIISVCLHRHAPFDGERLSRKVYTNSSCGICGRTSLEFVRALISSLPTNDLRVTSDSIFRLPERVRQSQVIFSETGGLHAAALFDARGKLLCVREDVGRHNALDKLVGAQLLARALPATNTIAFVSGRASFELVQKTLMAGIPILVAIGAPSSLAIALANEFRMTLVGFLRNHRFNIYSGKHRIVPP